VVFDELIILEINNIAAGNPIHVEYSTTLRNPKYNTLLYVCRQNFHF
jgi:hypothetical protein